MHDAKTVDDALPLTARVFLILWALADKPQHAYGLLAEVERRAADGSRSSPDRCTKRSTRSRNGASSRPPKSMHRPPTAAAGVRSL